MTNNNIYSHKGFNFGIYAIGLIVFAIVISLLVNSLESDFYSMLIGLPVFVGGLIGVIGIILSIRGIKEPNTVKKIVGIIINLGIATLFFTMIVANIYDIYMALVS
ncbi:hypothetical protein MHTCC0001_34760 [Flavobacteriaceae bacterium MHTCC 0001]